jgi:hypothetical protein
MIESFLHRLLRNLVEGHAANLFSLFGVRSKLQRQVVRNRLALAVRVRRQKNLVRFGGQLFQLVHHFLFARGHHQFRHKRPILKLHANFVLGQVHDVPHRGPHLKALAKIFLDRLRLGRRFNDHQ